jgi:predicted kinase
VLAGKPGTGKTTLARGLVSALHAVYLRVDAIETAVIRSGLAELPVGVVGYLVAQEVARSNILLGAVVVVDAVNPVPDARRGWRVLASETGVSLTVFETSLVDVEEHRRRVIARLPDLPGQSVPTWEQVGAGAYEPWDVGRDGPRIVIDTTDAQHALSTAISTLDQ